MTYKVFGGTLSLTQSINQLYSYHRIRVFPLRHFPSRTPPCNAT